MHTKTKSGVLHIIFVEVGQLKLISISSVLPNMHQIYLHIYIDICMYVSGVPVFVSASWICAIFTQLFAAFAWHVELSCYTN